MIYTSGLMLCLRFSLFYTRDTCYSSVYTPFLVSRLCMVTYFYAELAPGLVVRRLGDRFWLKRGIPVPRWCLDLYFFLVHTRILLCCNITMIYNIDDEAIVYSIIHIQTRFVDTYARRRLNSKNEKHP